MKNYSSLVAIINNNVDDPRIDRTKLHNLVDILMIAVCAAICGMTGWEEIQEFGRCKEAWFRKFLALPNGIPSHDTFRRLFERINPQQLQTVLLEWHKTLDLCLEGKIVAIDGKTLRASLNKSTGTKALHTLSAWVTDEKLVLGQCAVDRKENEIVKIPTLLEMLDVKNAIITIDAMGCQKNITKHIVEKKKADFVIALKKNQKSLHNEAEALFRMSESYSEIEKFEFIDNNKEHGRIEKRVCTCISASQWLDHVTKGWTKVQSVAKIVSTREIQGVVTEQTRYFISSLPPDAKRIAKAVRAHWSIENTLHWSLDVVMKEDSIHIYKDNSPQNLSIIRRIAFSIAKDRTPPKMTTKRAQLRAVLDPDFADAHFLKI